MLRDKSYICLDNGMMFNVTGYEHPVDSVFASLKYVAGKKWTASYGKARQFLLSEDPSLVNDDGYVCIPRSRIRISYDPFERWRELELASDIGSLHRQALELGQQLQQLLGVHDLGVTDSLLWGEGNVQSDIDLVVRGRDNTQLINENVHALFANADFSRPDPHRMKAPFGNVVDDWPRVLSRKPHMGSFRDRLFSLRVVLHDHEIESPSAWRSVATERAIHFCVAENAGALLFPAVYQDQQGVELVDYSVVYEGVFQVGDVVHCVCEHLETTDSVAPKRDRFILQDVIHFGAT